MFTKQEIKNNILGVFEIFLFMRQGLDRFSSSKKSAIHSFLIPVAMIPLLILIWILKSDGTPLTLLIVLHSVRIVLSSILSLSAVFCISKGLKKNEHFFRYITACNWFSIASLILTVPIFLQLGLDINLFEKIEVYAIFMSLVDYLYLAYITTQVFRIPWELGASTAILIMGIDQTMLKAMSMLKALIV